MSQQSRKQTLIAVLLVVCVAIVAFWEIMSNVNRGPSASFELTSEDLSDFQPASERWQVRSFPVQTTPMEPNIGAYLLEATHAATTRPYLVRLVHGYNMCDCMRIKGYTVDLIHDTRSQAGELSEQPQAKRKSFRIRHSAFRVPLQVWRLTSATGDNAIWITSMLRTSTFAATDVDVRSMAFPRIGIPDDPRWMPRGITLKSLRHPIRNLRMALRAKWNNSRADLLTFLGLRRPAWASDEMLTLVTASRGAPVKPDDEPRVIKDTVAAHTFMLGELRRWREEEGS